MFATSTQIRSRHLQAADKPPPAAALLTALERTEEELRRSSAELRRLASEAMPWIDDRRLEARLASAASGSKLSHERRVHLLATSADLVQELGRCSGSCRRARRTLERLALSSDRNPTFSTAPPEPARRVRIDRRGL